MRPPQSLAEMTYNDSDGEGRASCGSTSLSRAMLRGTSLKPPLENSGQTFRLLALAFPYHDNAPAETFQQRNILAVAPNVSIELGIPIPHVACWPRCGIAPGVLMPEAAVDENGNTMTCKDYIWSSGQHSRAKAKPIAEVMQN